MLTILFNMFVTMKLEKKHSLYSFNPVLGGSWVQTLEVNNQKGIENLMFGRRIKLNQ